MGALLKQIWISRECRKLVSPKLQRRLTVISMQLGVSVFLIFLGALMWALIASNRDPAVSLEALKYVSYAFFGLGGAGCLAFCFLWLVYVRDAKFEIRQQELRNAPDMFRFPPPQPVLEDPHTQLTDLHSAGSRPDIHGGVPAPDPRGQRPGVVSPSGYRHPSGSSLTEETFGSPAASTAASVSFAASDRPLGVTAKSPGRHLSPHPFDFPQHQPPRPRAVSHSESLAAAGVSATMVAVVLEPSTLVLSRPSSVTTSSSKERFIV